MAIKINHMKEYFFLIGKEQNGPFSIEELKTKTLNSETLVWTDGMEKWQKIKEIPDLTGILRVKKVPPPPPLEKDEKTTKTEVSGRIEVTSKQIQNPAFEAIKPSRKVLTWLFIWCSFHLFALVMSYSGITIFNESGNPHTNKFWPFVDFTCYKIIEGYTATRDNNKEFEKPLAAPNNIKDNEIFINKNSQSINPLTGKPFELQSPFYESGTRPGHGGVSTDKLQLALDKGLNTTGNLTDDDLDRLIAEADAGFAGIFKDYDWTEFAFYVGGAIIIFLLFKISKKDIPSIKKG